MEKLLLQEERSLDDVLKNSLKTFRNGCNFSLVKEKDEKFYLEFGCYGVHVNLLTGDEKLLYKWFMRDNPNGGKKCISDLVSHETIAFLLAKEPCKQCGGFKFYNTSLGVTYEKV